MRLVHVVSVYVLEGGMPAESGVYEVGGGLCPRSAAIVWSWIDDYFEVYYMECCKLIINKWCRP